MSSAYAKFSALVARIAGKRSPMIFVVQFTTNGSGVATLVDDYNGALTLTKSTNDYIITIGSYTKLMACVVQTTHASVYNDNIANSPTNGTVTIEFSASLASARANVIIVVEA